MGAARSLRLLGILVFILAVYCVVPVSREPSGGLTLRVLLIAALLAVVAVGMVAQLRLAAREGDHRIDGLVAAIVAMVVTFSYVFYALEVHRPHQFDGLETRLDALYFAVSTTLTVGYGDVHAAGQAARAIVLVQMVFNIVFVATAAAVLTARVQRVATERAAARAGSPAGPRPGRRGPGHRRAP